MFWRPITESNERGFVADYVTIYHVNTANPKQAPKIVLIEQPCGYTDAMLRKRYLAGRDVPVWWLGWLSTQAWLASTVKPLDNNMFYKFHKAAS